MGCNNGKCGMKGACTVQVGALLGQAVAGEGVSEWPGELGGEHPGGSAATAVGGDVPAITSNCMAAGPNLTACQVRRMRSEHRTDLYALTTNLGDGSSPLSGYTPDGVTYLFDIPTEGLTACLRITEIRVRVWDASAAAFVVGTAADGVPATMANARSAWHTQEDGAEVSVSVSTGKRNGRVLVSTEGRCDCEALYAWSPYDLPAQIEFTAPLPVGFLLAAGDFVRVEMQVERTYIHSAECEMPERCGETVYQPDGAP